MPNIYNALILKGWDPIGQQIIVTCEVQQLLGNNRVRAVVMSVADGLMMHHNFLSLSNKIVGKRYKLLVFVNVTFQIIYSFMSSNADMK